MIMEFDGLCPDTAQAAFIAPDSSIIGAVSLGPGSSVWFHATIRADIASITVGNDSSVQDNAVIHVAGAKPTVIGQRVTIGHAAVLHSCTIGDDCLIGMGSVVLDEATIGPRSIVAAGTLVPPGKTFPPESLIMGSPAKLVRSLTEAEIADIVQNAHAYRELAARMQHALESSENQARNACN